MCWGHGLGSAHKKRPRTVETESSLGNRAGQKGGKRAGSSWPAGLGPQLQGDCQSPQPSIGSESYHGNCEASVGWAWALAAGTFY